MAQDLNRIDENKMENEIHDENLDEISGGIPRPKPRQPKSRLAEEEGTFELPGAFATAAGPIKRL